MVHNKFLDDFQLLFESGIYPALVINEKYRKQMKRKTGTIIIMQYTNMLHLSVRPIVLSGSVQTVFEICGLLLLLAFLIEVAEVKIYAKQKLSNF